MTVWSSIGLFLLVHLIVGFLIGIKIIYVEQEFEDLKQHMLEGMKELDPSVQHLVEFFVSKKENFLILITIMGYGALWMEINSFFTVTLKYKFNRLKLRVKLFKQKRILKKLNKNK